jgi:hypothetical protein
MDRKIELYLKKKDSYEKSRFLKYPSTGSFSTFFDSKLQIIVQISFKSLQLIDARVKEKLDLSYSSNGWAPKVFYDDQNLLISALYEYHE